MNRAGFLGAFVNKMFTMDQRQSEIIANHRFPVDLPYYEKQI